MIWVFSPKFPRIACGLGRRLFGAGVGYCDLGFSQYRKTGRSASERARERAEHTRTRTYGYGQSDRVLTLPPALRPARQQAEKLHQSGRFKMSSRRRPDCRSSLIVIFLGVLELAVRCKRTSGGFRSASDQGSGAQT